MKKSDRPVPSEKLQKRLEAAYREYKRKGGIPLDLLRDKTELEVSHQRKD